MLTIGQGFKEGDVPGGHYVSAAVNGAPVDVQQDTLTRWPDGSLRAAVLTVDTATAGTLQWTVTGAPLAGAELSKFDFLATGFDATIAIDGATLSARDLLVGTVIPVVDLQWLSGPLCACWVVGAWHQTHYFCAFHVYYYADGRAMVDFVVENTKAWSSTARSYSATLRLNGVQVDQRSVTHYGQTRWVSYGHWTSDPQLEGYHATAYLMASGLGPNYKPDIGIDRAYFASSGYVPFATSRWLTWDGWDRGGGYPQIGLMTAPEAAYLVDPCAETRSSLIQEALEVNNFSIHFRDDGTQSGVSGDIPTAKTYPTSAFYGGTNTPALAHSDNPANQIWLDGGPGHDLPSHAPSAPYLAALVTGRFVHVEELLLRVNANVWGSGVARRNAGDGVINEQSRSTAWGVRDFAQLLALLPPGFRMSPFGRDLAADMSSFLAATLAWVKSTWIDSGASPLGYLPDQYQISRPWMADFFAMAMGRVLELGLSIPDAPAVAAWAFAWPTGRMGEDDQSPGGTETCWTYGPHYDSGLDARSYPTHRAYYEAWRPAEANAACPLTPPVEGWPDSRADSYAYNLWAAAVMAYDHGAGPPLAVLQRYRAALTATGTGTYEEGRYPQYTLTPRA